MDMDDDDLESLRQAALQTLGKNRSKQPSDDLGPGGASGEELNSEDYVVEEFVLEDSDGSINSSDCDEVIEEVIMSDPEDACDDDALVESQDRRPANNKDQPQQKRSRSRSLSSHRQNESDDDDESDAVSIKSSYSLILDDGEDFQSVESKFLSRKLQNKRGPSGSTNAKGGEDNTSRRGRRSRSRSPLPFRTSRPPSRRSRSRSRERDIMKSTNRKSRSRSRSPPPPVRRRNHSPLQRGPRRPFRTNSDDRNPRRRRTRSRSPPTTRSSPPAPRNRFANQNQSNRRPKSRSKSPGPGADKDKPKPRSTSSNQSGAPKAPPAEEPQAEKIVKTIKNNHVSPEHMERLEKRRRKFEGESEMVAPTKKVIKIMPPKREKQLPTTAQSTKQAGSPEKSAVVKEKVQKSKSKRSVELVNESDLNPPPAKHNEKVGNQNRHNNEDSSREKSAGGDNQEDLRARLIKKKMEKQLQEGSGRKTGGSSSTSGSSNGHLSSVVVPVGSQRIFSQALKNSQLLDMSSEASSSSKGSSKLNRNKPSLNTSTAESPTKSHKPKSVIGSSRNSEGSSSSSGKKLSSSRGGTGSSASTSSNRSKSSGTKRVVSVTYS